LVEYPWDEFVELGKGGGGGWGVGGTGKIKKKKLGLSKGGNDAEHPRNVSIDSSSGP